jgi:mannosyltransferase
MAGFGSVRSAAGEVHAREGSRVGDRVRAFAAEMRAAPTALPVALFTAIGGAWRFLTLDTQSFWADEGWTVGLVQRGFGEMLTTVPDTESAPHLYYVLAWGWTQVFGSGEVGLRSLSAVFGTATIPVAAAAAGVFSHRAAIVAAALVSLNPLLVWYSQESRAYALLVLLATVSYLAFFRFLRERRRGALVAWGLAAALAVATHYFAVFVVAPQVVWLLVTERSRRVSAAVAAPTVVGLALLPLALHQAGKNWAFQGIALQTRVAQIPKQFLTGYDAPQEKLAAVAAAALAAYGVFLLAARGRSRRERPLVIPGVSVLIAATAAPLVLALAGRDYVLTLYFIAALALALILLAHGFAATRTGVAAAVALCGLFATIDVAVAVTPQYQRDDWRGAAHALGAAEVSRAVVVTPDSVLGVHAPELRRIDSGSASVVEVALVGMAVKARGGRFVAPTEFPRPPSPFRLVRTVRDEKYTVVIFRAARPQRLTVTRLRALHLGTPDAGVTVQLQRPS